MELINDDLRSRAQNIKDAYYTYGAYDQKEAGRLADEFQAAGRHNAAAQLRDWMAYVEGLNANAERAQA